MVFEILKTMDSIIPYPTPKYARIKDSNLGLLRLALLFCIFVYIFGYQILYRGNHLEMTDLHGVYQLHLDQPTRDECDPININCQQNFTNMAELPYCSQSAERATLKLPCVYMDAAELEQDTVDGFLLPTHIRKYLQKPGCHPSAQNDWTCTGWLYDFVGNQGHVQTKRGKATPVSDKFVADTDRFTLTIDHSVESQVGRRVYSTNMKGYVMECDHTEDGDKACKKRPVDNGPFHAITASLQVESSVTSSGNSDGQRAPAVAGKDLRAEPKMHQEPPQRSESMTFDEDGVAPEVSQLLAYDMALEREDALQARAKQQRRGSGLKRHLGVPNNNLDTFGVISSPQGDVFTIGKLVSLAGVSMDKRRHHEPSWVGGSYRSSGFALIVRIHYSNVEPWLGLKCLPWRDLGPQIHYTYRVSNYASHDDFMLRKVTRDPRTNMRVLKEFAGIHILLEQSGNMALWDNIQVIIIACNTLALVHFANWLTDTIALNCLPKSEDYKAIKFDRPRMKAHASEKEGAPTAETDNIKRYASMTM